VVYFYFGVDEKGGPDLLQRWHLVLETAKTVFLIETKKKPLTRQAQAGNTLQAFVDLMGGVMDSQLQLGRHELQLRKFGRIDFNDGTRLDLGGRAIARLAVTLLDWGGTQDRIVLRQLASNLIGSALSSPSADADYQRALDKANVTLSKLQAQQAELQALGIDPRNLLGNWWFLSVPQLLFVLDGVASADAFEARLRSVSAITFGQLDFYRELSNVEAWKPKVWYDTAAHRSASFDLGHSLSANTSMMAISEVGDVQGLSLRPSERVVVKISETTTTPNTNPLGHSLSQSETERVGKTLEFRLISLCRLDIASRLLLTVKLAVVSERDAEYGLNDQLADRRAGVERNFEGT
jgi:hypothetical protein